MFKVQGTMFEPPPPFDVAQGRLSSPATRGRTKEGELNLESFDKAQGRPGTLN
jgi:hypothetical protein